MRFQSACSVLTVAAGLTAHVAAAPSANNILVARNDIYPVQPVQPPQNIPPPPQDTPPQYSPPQYTPPQYSPPQYSPPQNFPPPTSYGQLQKNCEAKKVQAEQTLKCYNAPVDTCKVQSVNIENCEQKYAQPVEQFVPHVQAGLRASLPACQEEEHRIVEYYKQTKENYRVIVVQECEVEGAQQPAPVYACHDVLVQGNDKPEYRTVTHMITEKVKVTTTVERTVVDTVSASPIYHDLTCTKPEGPYYPLPPPQVAPVQPYPQNYPVSPVPNNRYHDLTGSGSPPPRYQVAPTQRYPVAPTQDRRYLEFPNQSAPRQQVAPQGQYDSRNYNNGS